MLKDRTLTNTALINFIEHLDAQPERAAQRYVQLHKKLTCWFLQRECVAAEDLAQETLDLPGCAAFARWLADDYQAAVRRSKNMKLHGRERQQRLW